MTDWVLFFSPHKWIYNWCGQNKLCSLYFSNIIKLSSKLGVTETRGKHEEIKLFFTKLDYFSCMSLGFEHNAPSTVNCGSTVCWRSVNLLFSWASLCFSHATKPAFFAKFLVFQSSLVMTWWHCFLRKRIDPGVAVVSHEAFYRERYFWKEHVFALWLQIVIHQMPYIAGDPWRYGFSLVLTLISKFSEGKKNMDFFMK